MLNTNKQTKTAKPQQEQVYAQSHNKSYRELQLLAKELRAQGFFTGKLTVKKEELVVLVNEALHKQNISLHDKNEQLIRGNQSPRLQAGSRVNLYAGSKARKEREGAYASASGSKHNELNKQFYKRQQELSGVTPTDVKKASNDFSYKRTKLDLSLMK